MTANIHRDQKKQRRPFEVGDFCLLGPPGKGKSAVGHTPQQSFEDMKRVASALTIGLGGTVIRKEETP